MSSMQEDIQCAGSDTRPPMLDRTDFESWQQRIRLYCLGKDNGENIMKSIKEGPFHMGTVSDVIAGGTEGAVQQGPVRARVLNDLSAEEKERYKADIRATNILLQGIPKDIYSLINHYTDAKDIWENVKMILEGSELTKDDRESQLYDEFEHFRQNRRNHSRILPSSNARNKAMVQDGKVVVQDVRGRYNATNQGRPFPEKITREWCTGNVGAQNRGGMINPGQAKPIKCYNYNGLGHIAREQFLPTLMNEWDYSTENDFVHSMWTNLWKWGERGMNVMHSTLTFDGKAPDFNSKIKNLEHRIKEKDNVIRHLKDLVASVNDRSREPYNAVDVTALIEQNNCDRVELEKVKQHYKELYDSIKIKRAHTSEKTSTMLNEIKSLKAQLRSK
ncbi:hypothetical protein Tco_0623363 [Tanacetum coccineum]